MFTGILLQHGTDSGVGGVNHNRCFLFQVKLREQSNPREVLLDVDENFAGVRVPENCRIPGRLSFQARMNWYEDECTMQKEPPVESHAAQELSELFVSGRFGKMLYCLHPVRHRPDSGFICAEAHEI